MTAEPPLTPYREAVARAAAAIRRREVDFIARVNTPWTMMGLEVWLDAHRGARGLVFVTPSTLTTRTTVPPATRRAWAEHPGVTVIDVAPHGSALAYRRTLLRRAVGLPLALPTIAVRLRGRDPITFVGPRRPDSSLLFDLGGIAATLGRAPRFEVLDEGYGGAPVLGWHSLLANGQDVLQWAIRSAWEVEDHFLATPKGPDEALVSRYRATLERHVEQRSLDRRARPIALLITSYWAHHGWMTEENERRMFRDMASALDRRGYAIRLKQHPRETPHRYDADIAGLALSDFGILPQNIVAEAYLANLDARRDIVVGPLSNTHYTAQVLFDLPAIVVSAAPYDAAEAGLVMEREYEPLLPKGVRRLTDLADVH